jgi:hypothetical protein
MFFANYVTAKSKTIYPALATIHDASKQASKNLKEEKMKQEDRQANRQARSKQACMHAKKKEC